MFLKIALISSVHLPEPVPLACAYELPFLQVSTALSAYLISSTTHEEFVLRDGGKETLQEAMATDHRQILSLKPRGKLSNDKSTLLFVLILIENDILLNLKYLSSYKEKYVQSITLVCSVD